MKKGVRPSLKKMLFPVYRPGDYKRADWELFFHFCNFLFFLTLFLLFSYIKKTKTILRPPDWP